MPVSKLAPHPFSLRQLQYAVAVADALSFRQAAEQCHVSQPSLSAQIAELERMLGFQLFERDRRGVLISSSGARFLEQARRVLIAADELREVSRNLEDPLSATVRIGVIPTVSPYLLPVVAPALRKEFPKLRLLWAEDRTEALLRMLHEGRIDAAIVARESADDALEQTPLADDAFVLFAPANHPLVQDEGPLPLKQLREAELLLLEEGHCLRDQALAVCSRAHAQESEFHASSLATLSQMVAGGLGVTLLPELAVPLEARRSDAKVRRFSDPAPRRTLVLAWRKRAALGDLLAKVGESLRRAYPDPRKRRSA